MNIDKPLASKERSGKLREMKKIQLHNTDMNFLAHHMGLRPGCVHILIASSGSGKSALMRKIIKDTSKTSRCLVWLTEESRDEFSETITLQEIENEKNIRVVDEDSFKSSNTVELFNEFKKAIFTSFDGLGAEVVFYDNITTSAMLPSRIDDVSKFHMAVINLAKETLKSDKPMSFWVIAHTKKEIPQLNHSKLLSIEDIRGSQTICNRAQFAYTLQLFRDEAANYYSIVKTHKQRGYDMDPRYYSLLYNPTIKTFQRDVEVNSAYVKNIFNKREKL